MTFADAFLFLYVTFATVAFTCALAYFAARGLQRHLADHKHVREMRKADDDLRRLMKDIER